MSVSSSFKAPSDSGAQDALAFAYQYGYPLLSYGRFVRNQVIPVNTFYHERDVIKPGWTKVVRPNNDTLYSSMFVDLSQTDLQISVPEFDKRFWSFSFHDVYGNNYAAIMSHAGNSSGNYRLRYAADDFGLHLHDSGSTDVGFVNSPTPYGVLTVRILLKDQTTDVKTVHAYQDTIKVTQVTRNGGPAAPPCDYNIFTQVAKSGASEAEQVLQLTAKLAAINLSEVITDRGWIAYTLAKAGIRDGVFTQPAGTSLDKAVETAYRSAKTLKMTAGFVIDLGHNWFSNSSLIQGDFRSFYQARFLGAMRGYLGATTDQCVYPAFVPPSAVAEIPDIEIGARQAMVLSFSGKPRIHSLGFWSVSLYGKDQLFIENDLEHYSLGCRSDLKCVDGELLTESHDRPFDIIIQPGDIPPPAAWKSNWLPAPPGGGVITFTLRLFGAGSAMIDGSYEYPKITFRDAIRDGQALSKL